MPTPWQPVERSAAKRLLNDGAPDIGGTAAGLCGSRPAAPPLDPPAAHRSLGTFPRGCVRFGLGAYNTLDDVELALNAVSQLAREVA